MSQQKRFNDCWPPLKSFLGENRNREGERALRDPFLELIFKERAQKGGHYLTTIKGLNLRASEMGTRWLQGIVTDVTEGAFHIIPGLNSP